jgi:hypothetical protein
LQDLILVDPDDEVEIRAILAFHGDRSAGYVKCVKDETTLDRVFKYFKSSYIHLLFAYKEQEVRTPQHTHTQGWRTVLHLRCCWVRAVSMARRMLECVSAWNWPCGNWLGSAATGPTERCSE